MRLRMRVLHVLVCVAASLPNAESQTCGKNKRWVSGDVQRLGIGECVDCNYGEYSDDGKHCQYCPTNTLVSDGKFDRSISNWCEKDCLVIWKYMFTQDHVGMKDFIPIFANVPCVRDKMGYIPDPNPDTDAGLRKNLYWKCRNGESSCKTLAASCNTLDDTYVHNSIVVWDGGDKGLEYGNFYRKCDLCPKGQYRSSDKSVCLSCPRGFVGARFPEDPNSFIPPDVIVATDLVKQQTWPKADFNVFGCRACSVLNGIAKDGSCVPCAATQYQESKMDEVDHPTMGKFSVVVGIQCTQCPAGFEFFNNAASNYLTPCRSTKHEDCCRPCRENKFSIGGPKCADIPENEVGLNSNNAFAAFGASKHRRCNLGEELIYCMSSVCSTIYNKAKLGWKTCKPCTLSGTKKQIDAGNCGECKDEGKDLPTQGKPGDCTHCSLCSKLEITLDMIKLHVIPKDLLDQHSMGSVFSYGTYSTETKTAECKPLGRRLVYDLNGVTRYNDEYRKTLKDSTVYQVPPFQTIERELDNCTLKRCSEVCNGIFVYSPGCGPQISSPGNMWVMNGTNKVPLTSITDVTILQKGLFVTHGPCMVCKTCERGYYNDQCNVYRDGVDPQGMCQLCKSSCAENEYMHHRDGDGRCDFPLSTRQHTDSKWKVSSNYECKKCPTWVLEKRDGKEFLHTVTACGQRSQYESLDFDTNNNLAITTKTIQKWNDQEQDETLFGNQWKKYRSFMRDLQPYCPELYFYDFSVEGCELDSLLLYEKDTYTIPNSIPPRNVTVGFRRHNPKCCVLCKEPNPLTDKKGPDWQQCMGDTTTDVQNSYVKRCGRGYWEDRGSLQEINGGNVSVCKKCKTCHEGMILDS